MRYLVQPRGPGKSFVFRIKTPPELIGRLSPHTGQPFGAEIKIGLRTRRLPEAKKKRDYHFGKVRELQEALSVDGRFSMERADAWAREIARHDESAEGTPDELDVRSVLMDEIEHAASLQRR